MSDAEITRMGYDVARDSLFIFRADGERKYYEFSKPLCDAITGWGAAMIEADKCKAAATEAAKHAKELKSYGTPAQK